MGSDDAPYPEGTLVRVSSHRARQKLERLLGFAPQSYFNLSRGNDFYYVPTDRAAEVLAITGIKPAREVKGKRLMKSWGSTLA